MRLYFYCIFISEKKTKTCPFQGFDRQRVFHIYNKDLFAAVSVTKKSSYNYNEENLKIHTDIIDFYDKNYNILPFRFNTIVGEKLGKGILFKYYEELIENLRKVNKKVQFELKVFKSKPLQGELINDSSKIDAFKLKDKILDVKTKYLVSQINGPLLKIADDHKIDRLVTNNLILSSKYLINQKEASKFAGELNRMKSIFSELYFYIKGSEPPFDFVDVEITKDNAFIK